MVNRPDNLSHLRFRLPVVRVVAAAAAVVVEAALPLRQLLPLGAHPPLVHAAHAVARFLPLSNRNLGKFINVQFSSERISIYRLG
jgi:hypothetical protein